MCFSVFANAQQYGKHLKNHVIAVMFYLFTEGLR